MNGSLNFVISLLLILNFSKNIAASCVATELIQDDLEEIYNFTSPEWDHYDVSITSAEYNIAPMTGEYTYEIDFCNQVNVYSGSDKQLGWSFGSLSAFHWIDVSPPVPAPAASSFESSNLRNPHDQYSAYNEFFQVFSGGDAGPPCAANPRKAQVNIYCGGGFANCTQVPYNKGASCLNGGTTPTDGYCLCSVVYTNICQGLTLNVLSNQCPRGQAIVIPTPPGNDNVPENSPGKVVGIAFGVLAAFVLGITACIVFVNCLNGKRGCATLPFYETCTGTSEEIRYSASPEVETGGQGYGTTSNL